MQDIDGYIFAGGASNRMGTDKATLQLSGKTFVERAADALSVVAGRITVVGSIPPGQPSSADTAFLGRTFRRIPDAEILLDGSRNASIKGLYSALLDGDSEWIAALACDLPFVGREFFQLLVEIGKRGSHDAFVPVQHDGRIQPLAALYRRQKTRDAVEESLANGELSLQRFVARMRVRHVAPDEYAHINGADIFFNVNTPEEFARATDIENAQV